MEALPAGDWATSPKYVKVTGEKDITRIYIVFSKTITFKGCVFDKNTMPIEGAEILICENNLWSYSPILYEECVRRHIGKIIFSDKDGKFTGHFEGKNFVLFAKKKGYSISRKYYDETDKSIIIRLDDEAKLTGQVVDVKGNPVNDAFLQAKIDDDYHSHHEGSDAVRGLIAKADSNGRFEFDGMCSSKYELTIKSSEQLLGTVKTINVGGKETADAGKIVVKSFRKINGIVQDKDGNGIKNAHIISHLRLRITDMVYRRIPPEDNFIVSRGSSRRKDATVTSLMKTAIFQSHCCLKESFI